MHSLTFPFMKKKGLRDTSTRRMVLTALEGMDEAASPRELQEQIAMNGHDTHLMTIYRIVQALQKAGMVHIHPCDGRYFLCRIPDKKGHHGFLHCTSCGTIEEFCDKRLCSVENRIAKSAKFQPVSHMSEITGICHSCR